MCARWRFDFVAFLDDMGPRPGDEYELDRFPNNNGDYEPGNCRWATRKQQTRNTRRNVKLCISGCIRCVTDWSIVSGVSADTIGARIERGWDARRAVFSQPHTNRCITIDGETRTITQWAKLAGVSDNVIRSRLKRGWAQKRAVFHLVDKRFLPKKLR